MKETRETPVRSLGGEDRLEKEIATHSSILDVGEEALERSLGHEDGVP